MNSSMVLPLLLIIVLTVIGIPIAIWLSRLLYYSFGVDKEKVNKVDEDIRVSVHLHNRIKSSVNNLTEKEKCLLVRRWGNDVISKFE